MLLFLLRARFIAVDELAAEVQDRTVGPVFGHLERRGDRDHEFVLILEPDALAVHNVVAVVIDHRLAVGIETLRLHLHPVIAQLGTELGFDGEKILGENMAQADHRRKRDGVVTARHRDPRVVVRGKRALHPAVEFEVVALLADRGALGLVTGAAEIIDIYGYGFQFVLKSHALLPGIDFVDGNLGRDGAADQKSRNKRQYEIKRFHSEVFISGKLHCKFMKLFTKTLTLS